MTLIQEAYSLMREQPERNLRLIVDLLHTMTPKTTAAGKRTGLANGTISFPVDFDEHFDDLNDEITDMFTGAAV